MKPELESRRVFAITRAKGKMFEFGVEESAHLRIPQSVTPGELLLLTVGILGDVAASFHDGSEAQMREAADVQFAASFFDAYLASALDTSASSELQLLASAAYYLADRPGSSLVIARRIQSHLDETVAERFVRWLLQAKWEAPLNLKDEVFVDRLETLASLISTYFSSGQGEQEIASQTDAIRRIAYRAASSWDLLQIDIAAALIHLRLRTSSWRNLPQFMNLPEESLASTIRKDGFPKELWPSQMLLGKEGLFQGASGVIQMPTSAGKTRSVEIVLRGALLGRKIRIAIIVAPFRALCHEIATSLRLAFHGEEIKVNELSDALQLDFLDEISELFGGVSSSSQGILILTPEKLLYVLRQRPDLVKNIGLVVYDEGHQFDSDGRGITYELLLTSLKVVLPSTVQIVLISAVIKNAQAVGDWLIGDDVRIVNGSKLLPTARSIAFASWHETLGQVFFYEDRDYTSHDYFVPRVIEQVQLNNERGERALRYFPDRNEKKIAKEVSLHLGLRLVGQGAVAIFCGRKDTASNMAARAAEIHSRGYAIQWPSAVSDEEELRRLVHLVDCHFGNDYFLSEAARLGIFVHHGNTPHGLRMCIESAMQRQLVRFVICTSTLAQGVNLPIRYLIVSSIWQADDVPPVSVALSFGVRGLI
jgi:POLQ-like helicase